jgi:hypothetical protein
MKHLRYCPTCTDYIPSLTYREHMKQHNIGNPLIQHEQYLGSFSKQDGSDYMICLLHQKKTPCPVKDCNYHPFGMLRKSLMMSYIKSGIWIWYDGSNTTEIPIDSRTRTVTIMGVPIFLKA